jgi:hypothetical protein
MQVLILNDGSYSDKLWLAKCAQDAGLGVVRQWEKMPGQSWRDIGSCLYVPAVAHDVIHWITFTGPRGLRSTIDECPAGLILLVRSGGSQIAVLTIDESKTPAVLEAFQCPDPVATLLLRCGVSRPTYGQIVSAYVECGIPCVG